MSSTRTSAELAGLVEKLIIDQGCATTSLTALREQYNEELDQLARLASKAKSSDLVTDPFPLITAADNLKRIVERIECVRSELKTIVQKLSMCIDQLNGKIDDGAVDDVDGAVDDVGKAVGDVDGDYWNRDFIDHRFGLPSRPYSPSPSSLSSRPSSSLPSRLSLPSSSHPSAVPFDQYVADIQLAKALSLSMLVGEEAVRRDDCDYDFDQAQDAYDGSGGW